MWRILTKVITFRGTRSIPSPERSPRSPVHPSLREKFRYRWQCTRAAGSSMWGMPAALTFPGTRATPSPGSSPPSPVHPSLEVEPDKVAVDPSGKFVYVTNFGHQSVSGYMIDPSTGALTSIAGSFFTAKRFATGVAVHPSGKFVYVAAFSYPGFSGNISGYTINPEHRGAHLHRRFTLRCGRRAARRGGGPERQVRLCGEFRFGNVSGYTINLPTGALTPIAGSPFPAGEKLRAPWRWTRAASSPMWGMPVALTFRGTRSIPAPGRSPPWPVHPSIQEEVRAPWRWPRAARSPMWRIAATITFRGTGSIHHRGAHPYRRFALRCGRWAVLRGRYAFAPLYYLPSVSLQTTVAHNGRTTFVARVKAATSTSSILLRSSR